MAKNTTTQTFTMELKAILDASGLSQGLSKMTAELNNVKLNPKAALEIDRLVKGVEAAGPKMKAALDSGLNTKKAQTEFSNLSDTVTRSLLEISNIISNPKSMAIVIDTAGIAR